MSQTAMIVVAVIVVIALLLILLLRSRKQHVTFEAMTTPPPMAPGRPATPPVAAPVTPPAPVPPIEEGHGVGSEVAAAIEDVVDQFVGIDAHPSGQPAETGDRLTLLKGLGPKAEAVLHQLGVTHFDQIAAWTPADVEAIDAQLGAFKGRIVRDRWVEQAKFLAKGDTAGFEAAFGKLGQ